MWGTPQPRSESAKEPAPAACWKHSPKREPAIRQGRDADLLAEERKLADRISLKERQRSKSVSNPQAARQTEALSKELDALLDQYRALQSRIRATSPRYAATEPQPLTAQEVQISV